jgi:hypothetical protein
MWVVRNDHLFLLKLKIMITEEVIGKRIRLIEMVEDPRPITPGSEGVILHIGYDCFTVKWDNGRVLGVIDGVDKFEILD